MCPPASGAVNDSYHNSNRVDPKDVPDFVPTDDISKVAYEHAATGLDPAILNHSLRVFLYARSFAEREHSPWAAPNRLPLLFAACIYHDIGTCAGADNPQRFEVEGADTAAQDLRSANVPEEDVHEVWVAIAVHSSPHIGERISPLARLVRVAVLVDFKRSDFMHFTSDAEVEGNERMLPRMEIEKVLGDAVVEQALKKPEKAPTGSWPGNLMRSKLEHPEWEGVNKGF